MALSHPRRRRYGLVLRRGNQRKQVTPTVLTQNDGGLAKDLRGDAQISNRGSYFRNQLRVVEFLEDVWNISRFYVVTHRYRCLRSGLPACPPVCRPTCLPASVFAPPAPYVSSLDVCRPWPGSRRVFLGKCRIGQASVFVRTLPKRIWALQRALQRQSAFMPLVDIHGVHFLPCRRHSPMSCVDIFLIQLHKRGVKRRYRPRTIVSHTWRVLLACGAW